MLATKPQPMTFEEYLEWEAQQPEKWELVDGYPVLRSERWGVDPVTGMAGCTVAHNLIVSNILAHLSNRLRGGTCRAFASHLKHQSATKSARYPDVSVNCGPFDPASLLAPNPRVIFDVLSRSNTPAQQMMPLSDYLAIGTLQHLVFVEQDQPAVLLWTRNDDGWRAETVAGLDATVRLPGVDAELAVTEIYEGLTFEADG